METAEWRSQFDSVMKAPPAPGTKLFTLDGSPAKVKIDLLEGRPPFMYGVAYVPLIVGSPVGWYLRSTTDKLLFGWKCILLPKARDTVIRDIGIAEQTVEVTGLKVVRHSREGRSLLCDLIMKKDEK